MNIHIAIKAPVGIALRQVLGLLTEITPELLDSEYQAAKVVIVSDKASLLRLHSNDKFFIILGRFNEKVGPLPKNAEYVAELSIEGILAVLSDEKAIDERIRQYAALPQIEKEVPIERIGTYGLNILVVDDTAKNRERAKECLKDNKLTIASSYGQAMTLLESERFHCVLTDLYLPASQHHRALSLEAMDFWQTVPYGILIALEAARRGMKVAVVTDANHHTDFFSAAFDAMRESYNIGGLPLLLINHCGKNWAKAKEYLELEHAQYLQKGIHP